MSDTDKRPRFMLAGMRNKRVGVEQTDVLTASRASADHVIILTTSYPKRVRVFLLHMISKMLRLKIICDIYNPGKKSFMYNYR